MLVEVVRPEIGARLKDRNVHIDMRSGLAALGQVNDEGVARYGEGRLARVLGCSENGAEATIRRNVEAGIFAEGSTVREVLVPWAYRPTTEECMEKLREMSGESGEAA